MSCNGGKIDAGTKKIIKKFLFQQNCFFGLKERHLQVFPVFRFLKNKKEAIGETQKF